MSASLILYCIIAIIFYIIVSFYAVIRIINNRDSELLIVLGIIFSFMWPISLSVLLLSWLFDLYIVFIKYVKDKYITKLILKHLKKNGYTYIYKYHGKYYASKSAYKCTLTYLEDRNNKVINFNFPESLFNYSGYYYL